MEEYRVDIKVRNNIILRKIEEHGYESLLEFCKINDGVKFYHTLIAIIGMKISPLKSDGEFKSCITFLANIISCDPGDLFSDLQMRTVLKTNKRSIEVREAEIKFLMEKDSQVKLLEEIVMDEQKTKAVAGLLETLTPREQKIIEMRNGLGEYDEHTIEECAMHFGVSRERIRQIEQRSLRKLRHPHRSKPLKKLFDIENAD